MGTSKHTIRQRFNRFSRPKKFAIITIGIFVFYVVSGFFIMPPIARLVLEKKLSPLVNRVVSVSKVRLNPLTLSASVEGFTIEQKDNPTKSLSFDLLEINLQAVSLFKQAIILKSVALTAPKINFSRIVGSTYSFSDLIHQNNKGGESSTSTNPFLFSINNIEIKNGDIQFFDKPKEKKHHIAKLNLAVASISNLPYDLEHFIKPSFSAVVNGTPFKLSGHAKPFIKSLETGVDINIKDFNIVTYLDYFPNPTRAKLTSCLLDINGKMNFSRGSGTAAGPKLSYLGQITFKNTTIANEAGEEFINLPEIAIQTSGTNILSQAFHLTSLRIMAPDIRVKRTKKADILPMAFLLPSKQERPAPLAKKAKRNTFRLDIDDLLLKYGRISFSDESVNDFTTRIEPVSIQVKNFSTVSGKKGQFELAFKTETNETVTSSGDFKLSPFGANGNITLKDISFAKYMPYVKSYILPELTSGLLGFSSDFSISNDDLASQEVLLNDMTVSIERLILQESGKPVFTLPEFNISGARINLDQKRIDLGVITSKQASLTIIQDRQKKLNLSSFLKKTEHTDSIETDKKISNTVPDAPVSDAEWLLAVDSANFSDYEIHFVDQGLATPATLRLHGMNLKMANFSTVKDSQGSVDLSGYLNESGKIAARGKFGISPISLSLETGLKKLAFKPFQSYIDESFYLFINSGSLSSAGIFSMTKEEKAPRFHFKGNSSIDNIALIDTRLNEDVMSWKKIDFNDIFFDSNPLTLTIGKIHIQSPFANISVLEHGRLNLTELVKKTAEEPEKLEDSAEQRPNIIGQKEINIEEVSVTGGSLRFIDHAVKPSYSVALSGFAGRIAGLSSDVGTRADVSFSGKLNQFSPLQISGVINPLAERFFADLKIDFHDIDLSPTSPYTGKYLGYKTDKGKLSLKLHYLVDDKEIEAQNNIFLDQFTLGDEVDSPDAADLPISLAIALLQNRDGEISLDIPVVGNLDDPKFSVSGVVAKVIFNLIAKAVTSPFALLGALIPDGEDLQYIPFAAGKSEIPPEHLNKLAEIASVLYERPGLRMDIIGKIAIDEDRTALREMHLDDLLKLQKIKEQQQVEENKDEVRKLANSTVSAEEYPHYLELVYWTHNGQKERLSQKGVPVEKPSLVEMKEQLLADISVPGEDLRLLAHTRAANVKNLLLASGKVEAERLFLVEPQISSAQEGAEEIDAAHMVKQVELVIK